MEFKLNIYLGKETESFYSAVLAGLTIIESWNRNIQLSGQLKGQEMCLSESPVPDRKAQHCSPWKR